MNHQDESNPELKPIQADFPSIPDIEILEPIGRGGMAQVFKARQCRLDRIVAVKVLSKATLAGSNGIDRFHQEAKLCSALDDPVIVKILAYGLTKNEEPYLIFEYLDGVPLSDEIAKTAPITFRRFQSIFVPLLSALQKAHAAGIVHRDIKPANIMICENAENPDKPIVKLLDFGIAKLYDEKSLNLTRTGTVVGSPSFMSPEQCQNSSIDGRSDIYSLCCVMYMALSGEAPFKGDSAFDTMLMHVNSPVPTAAEFSSRMEVPIELSKLIVWGLAKEPANRPASAQTFADKLNAVLNDITLDKAPKIQSTLKKTSRMATLAAMAFVLISVLGLAVFFGKHSNKSELPILRTNGRQSVISRARQYISEAHRQKEDGKEEQAIGLAIKAFNLLGSEYPPNSKSAEFAHQDMAILRGVADIVQGLQPKKGSFDPAKIFVMLNYDNEFLSDEESAELNRRLLELVGSEGSLHCLVWEIQNTMAQIDGFDRSGAKYQSFVSELRKFIELESEPIKNVDQTTLLIAEMEIACIHNRFNVFDDLYHKSKRDLARVLADQAIDASDKINILGKYSDTIIRAGKTDEAIDCLQKSFSMIEKTPLTRSCPGNATIVCNKLVHLLLARNDVPGARHSFSRMERLMAERSYDFNEDNRKEIQQIRNFIEEQAAKLKSSL